MAAVGDEDVGRLDVAVDDPLGVGGFERVGEFRAEFKNSIGREWPPAIKLMKRRALQPFHRHKMAAGVLSDIVNRADVRMIEGRGGAGLALEPFDSCGFLDSSSERNFNATVTPQPRVFGQVDNAHATLAQLIQDAIVRDGLADHPVVVEATTT